MRVVLRMLLIYRVLNAVDSKADAVISLTPRSLAMTKRIVQLISLTTSRCVFLPLCDEC